MTALSTVLLFLIVQFPAPPQNVRAYDTPNDAGNSITVTWDLSPDDSVVSRYEIYRSKGEPSIDSAVVVGSVLRGSTQFEDNSVENNVHYYYFVRAWVDTLYADSKWSAAAYAKPQWFHTGRKSALVILIFFGILLFYYLQKAKQGAELYIRRIAGLEAVDEAVGRSTEMGRPILFILGLGFVSDIPTLAALAILKRVSKKAAEYESEVIVPCYDPVVMTAAQEVVKEGYMEAGRPDLYNERNIYYLTADQFGYAAGVDGIMVREKPGAVFLQGLFYAESLILAETGHSIGAIQISGTTAVTQLPFFIAATDYTLIGEEMYAASAYLSKDPLSLSTIKAEDVAKMVFVALFVLGVVLETLAVITGNQSFHFLKNWFALF